MGIAAAIVGIGTLAGAGVAAYGEASKGSPPAYNVIPPSAIEGQSVSANQAALPAVENLAGQSNQFNIDQVQKMLAQVIPGYNSISTGVAGNINSLLNGQIPTDVQNQLQDSDAARSLTGGFGGSGVAGNLTARDLGLTSLNLTQQGMSSAQSWLTTMSNINQPGMFNLSSMFLNPSQVAGFDAGQSQLQYQSQLGQYNTPNSTQIAGSTLEGLGGLGLGLLASSGNGLGTNLSSLFSSSGAMPSAAQTLAGLSEAGFGAATGSIGSIFGGSTPSGTGTFNNAVGPGGAGSNSSIDFDQLISQANQVGDTA